MNRPCFVLILAMTAGMSGCQNVPVVPAPAKPVLIDITGNGRWTKASTNSSDNFGFYVGAAEDCPPGSGGGPISCPLRYPDAAFIDFEIPTLTGFTVDSGGVAFTLVGDAVPIGDFQFRRSQLTDGSGATTRWRIALAVPENVVQSPPKPRTWCPPTTFVVNIVNEAGANRSAPLTIALNWGECIAQPYVVFATTGGSGGTPASKPPMPPAGRCAGGAAAKTFHVCQVCPGSSQGDARTIHGCDFATAKSNFPPANPSCVVNLRATPASGC